MKLKAIAAVAALGVAGSGCASIVKGSSQTIFVRTPQTTQARCVLTSERGTWRVTSPGRVRVKRSKDDMQVRCTKPGYADAETTIPSDFELWTLGNVLIGGLIGLGVDASTGAINEYNHVIEVPMDPTGSYIPAYPPTRIPNTAAPNS